MLPSEHDTLDTPGTSRWFSETGEIIDTQIHLIPAPSNDPEDPLSWSTVRKYLNLFCIFLYTIAMNVLSSALYSVYTPLQEDKNLTLDNLNSAQGYFCLFIGLACLITQPAALAFGKRPTYILSSVATGFINLLSLYGTGYGQWIGRCLLIGFALSPQFCLVEVSIADVFFMHERAFKLGLFCVALYVGVTLGPLLSGYVYDGMGWRAIIWLSSGFCWLTDIFLFFFLEETTYNRDPISETLTHFNHPENVLDQADQASSTKNEDGKYGNQTNRSNEMVVNEGIHPSMGTPWHGPKFWKFMKPHPYAGGVLIRGFLQPIMLIRNPIILFCAWIFGFYQMYFNFIAALTSGVSAEPPYNFSTSAVGLTFIGPLLASIPGAMFGGRLVDWFAIRMARRNHGIAEAEHKLYLFIIPVVGMVIGLLMMGLGPYYEAHWIVFVLGASIVNCVGPLATLLGLAYAFDCFHSIRPNTTAGPYGTVQDCAPYLLTVILVGMAIAFGFNYAITPWCFDFGFRNFAISAALSSIVINGVAYLIIWKGKSLRKSGEGYYRKVINY